MKKFLMLFAIVMALFVAFPLAASPPGGPGPVMLEAVASPAIYAAPVVASTPTAIFEAVSPSGSFLPSADMFLALAPGLLFSACLLFAAMLADFRRKGGSLYASLVLFDPRRRMTRFARDQTAYAYPNEAERFRVKCEGPPLTRSCPFLCPEVYARRGAIRASTKASASSFEGRT